jgi:NAD(P)-dependent dehydrogenase (short-subunit alcohol dehydrogenase family)/uncharacterized protein (DUF302 family)
MTSLEKAVVLVTGANGGLGAEFVRQSLERGADHVYAAARTPRDWDDPRVIPVQMDVTSDDSVAEVAESLASDTTIVINNAGILRTGSLTDGGLNGLREQMETNFFGPLRVTQAFAPALRASGGAVVNVASVLSWLAFGNGYSASKAALWSATDSLRLSFAPDEVQVVGAYLGYTDTPMTPGDMPKNDPADVVRAILDGLEAGAHEVLADDITRAARSRLALPVHERYELLPSPADARERAARVTHRVQERYEWISRRTFEDVIEKINGGLGHPAPASLSALLTSTADWGTYRAEVAKLAGPSGLFTFLTLDLGDVLRRDPEAPARKAVRIIAGNPVTMESMVRTSPAMGAYAPITILVYEAQDGVHVRYDTAASAGGSELTDDAAERAAKLDAAVIGLLESAV